MKRVATSVTINRSASEVFSFILDPTNMPKWAPGYLLGEWTSKYPIKLGSKQKRVTNFGGKDQESTHEVSQYKKNKILAFIQKSGPLLIEEIIEIEEVSGGTKVTIAEEVVSPLILKPAEWIFATMASKNIAKYGVALKDVLEDVPNP